MNLLRTIAALFLAFIVPALAQDYPTRTVTLVVPYPPGGGVDAMARVVAERLSATLGQQVVVDNRGGGSGLVGTRAVMKAAPDGYTLLLGHTGSISINPSLYANAGYDPRKDFSAIGLIASMPVVLIAHPSFPASTIADVVALAKKEPHTLLVGNEQGEIIAKFDTKDLEKKYTSLSDFLQKTKDKECKKISPKCRKCPDGKIYCTNDMQFASGKKGDENP